MRIDAGLTQATAAELAGVTREYWAHVECQGRNLTLATLANLASAVEKPLAELLFTASFVEDSDSDLLRICFQLMQSGRRSDQNKARRFIAGLLSTKKRRSGRGRRGARGKS